MEVVGKSSQMKIITFAYRLNCSTFSVLALWERQNKKVLCLQVQLIPPVPGVHEEEVHLHEGEDHVEDRVDAREQVPGAALLRNLKEVDELWTKDDPGSPKCSFCSKFFYSYSRIHTAKTQYRKFETNITGKGIARPLSPNFHILYSHNRSAYSAAGKYVDLFWEYINCSQTHECGNWEWGRAGPFFGNTQIGIFVAVHAREEEEEDGPFLVRCRWECRGRRQWPPPSASCCRGSCRSQMSSASPASPAQGGQGCEGARIKRG